jgi:hypothetical protein
VSKKPPEVIEKVKAGSPSEVQARQIEAIPPEGERTVKTRPVVNVGDRKLERLKGEDRALQRGTAAESTPPAELKGPSRIGQPPRRSPAAAPAYPLTEKQLDDAIELQQEAQSWEHFYWRVVKSQQISGKKGKRNIKTAACSKGQVTVSGPGYSKAPSEFPQRKAPGGMSESNYYVQRYEELSGTKPPAGNDTLISGDDFATHAEVKNRIHQFDDGTNNPTGVSKDMCRYCRVWHRQIAMRQGKRIEIADPHHVRVFNPDGTVDIYTVDKAFVRTVPADTPPSAGIRRYYEGVDW